MFLKHNRNSGMYLFTLVMCIYLAHLSALAQVSVRPASEIKNEQIDWIKKVADWQLTQSNWNGSVSWQHGTLHAGLMAAYEATKDEAYRIKCREWAEKFNWTLAWNSHHADNMTCGQAFTELYFLDIQDPGRYAHFKSVNDTIVLSPTHFNCDVTNGSETWWWADALFMAPPGLVRLSRATGDSSYADLMHMMWSETQSCLYDTTEHLFYRDINYFPPYNYNGKKVFWSRGNGWVLAGIVRLLQYLPQDDPNRMNYVVLLQEMSAKLLELQLEDGYWHSDLLSPLHFDNPETSGTGFFTYAMAWGINNGFLDEDVYGPAVIAGWEALKNAVQPSGLLGWVQPVGTGPQTSNEYTTAVFGVGAYLLAASEIQKYVLSKEPQSIEYFESYWTDADLQSVWIDGETNGTSSEVVLGNYGDNFMELTYQNYLPPYRSQVDYAFASPRDLTLNDAYYLSVLIRGAVSNASDSVYITLEDAAANTAVQIMSDMAVVKTAQWKELAFLLSDFNGIDLTQIVRLSIGIGSPDTSSPTGAGTVRIDNIHLSPCVTVQADFDGNCSVELNDFVVLADQWLDVYGTTITPTYPGTTNLVAYWPLDGDYDDATGNNYDAIGVGSLYYQAGHLGQSVYFDGSSYLEVANASGMDYDQGFTISAWIKSNGDGNPWASIVTKGDNAWRLIRYNTGSSLAFHFDAPNGTEYRTNGLTDVFDGQWHHVVGMYDRSSIYLYVDGQLDALNSAGIVNTTNDPVYIGSRFNRTTDRGWTGSIDDVRIYDAVLDEAEIHYLSESGAFMQIRYPRTTDLAIDGKIDLDDLLIFLETWTQNVAWPK